MKAAARCCGFFMVMIAVIAAALVATDVDAQAGRWEPANEASPALKLKAIDGSDIDLSTLKGRVVIVNFWATWCGPCIAEMPSLQALAARLGSANVALLGVNYHESAEKIRDFQKARNVNFPLLRDPWQEVSAAWKVKVLPTTFIVDSTGALRYRVVGEVDWSSKDVEKRLRPLLPASSKTR